MPDPITAVMGGTGLLGAHGANKAAKAQEGAARNDLALKTRIYDESVERLEPYTGAGGNALMAYLSELGLGQGPEGYQGMSMSPAANFALTQGRNTIESGAASRGGLFSGAAMKGLEGYRMGLATQDRDNQLNRLLGLTQIGQASAAGQNAAGQNFSVGAGNAYGAMGNARSAGAVGVTNSFNDALGQYVGYNAYTNGLNRMYPGQA